MKIIVLTRISAEEHEKEAAQRIKDKYPDVTLDSELDWKALRAQAGGYQEVYSWCAQTYDKFVIIPTYERCMAKGQYTILDEAMALGKPAVAWDEAGRCLRVVDGIQALVDADWKGAYAELFLGEEVAG